MMRTAKPNAMTEGTRLVAATMEIMFPLQVR